MEKAETAKRILKNYFYNVSIASGLNWTSNNDSDIELAVDDIIRTVLQTIDRKNHPVSNPTIYRKSEE